MNPWWFNRSTPRDRSALSSPAERRADQLRLYRRGLITTTELKAELPELTPEIEAFEHEIDEQYRNSGGPSQAVLDERFARVEQAFRDRVT